ncbi:MAG: hypothetical protein AB1716_09880 [Planctomycetota bacterium]
MNFGDINCFVAALTGETEWRNCTGGASCVFACVNDMNGDGRVDFNDINPFVALLTGS